MNLEQFVHDYYLVDRFKVAYGRQIEPMTGRSQWPHVQLPFVVGAPLNPRESGRQRKLWIKGCLEGGHKKRGRKDGEGTSSATNAGDNATNAGDTAPTNTKGKKMIRGPMTCKRCSEKGHMQASSKYPLNRTKKKRQLLFFLLQPLNHHVITNIIFLNL